MATTIIMYATLALSWDMMFRSGQPGLSVAGFFGLGGYAAALSFLYWGVNPLVSIALGCLFSLLVAFILGLVILRIRGLYFSIATMALSEIFRVIVMNWHRFTGGPSGKALPSAVFDGDSAKMFWLFLVLALLTIIVSEIFERSRVHFALTSIRNNEIVAKSSGIDVFKYLVVVFALTSALQGMIGGAYAHSYAFISPEGSFNFNFVLLPVTMALFGGIHSTLGPIVGAVILGVVGEYLKLQLPYGHLLVYGVIIVIVILFLPKGIVGTAKEWLRRK